MITQLLNTVKEISTVTITGSAKPRPICTCENEARGNNISDIKLIEVKERSVDITSNDNTVTNSQTLKISEQLKNAKRRKKSSTDSSRNSPLITT